jgi:superfamily II DNA or RNA helicase
LRELLQAVGPEGETEIDQVRARLHEVSDKSAPSADRDDIETRIYARAAERVFGTRLPKRALGRVGPVLVNSWLPKAQSTTLADLTNVTQTARGKAVRDQSYRGRPEQITFLQKRRRTNNFNINLADAFHREHRVSWLVPKNPKPEHVESMYELAGAGVAGGYEPYPHTRDAWDELDRLDRAGPLRGLVVLPTGAGKTDVAVGWLLRRLAAEPELRVLWLAHQVSLLDQAAIRFAAAAQELPEGFRRTLRIFASDREPMSLFNARKTDVACATIQTVSRKLGQRSKRRTEVMNFLKNPTVVVIDEAHHAASRSYQTLLNHFLHDETIHDVIGLTATPWARGETRQEKIDTAFPRRVITRSREELIASGILADYKVIPVRTHVSVDVTEDERQAAERLGDLPMSVLRKLETDERNAKVVATYASARERWGRTLLFTTTIANAEALGAALKDAHANVEVLHSQSATTIAKLKPWFADNDDAVIVSVGMLLEGVDLPKARTALIARATTSPNVLSQMVGRVLRGTAAGGEATANVVYMLDDWDDFTGTLMPTGPWGGTGAEELPPSAEARFPADVAAAIAEALDTARRALAPPDTHGDAPPRGLPGVEVMLEQRRVVGFYEALDERKIPVFDHQYDLLATYLAEFSDGNGTLAFEWPEDSPPPAVAPEHLLELTRYVEDRGCSPAFVPFAKNVAPIEVAQSLNDGTLRSRKQELDLIAAAYNDPFAAAVFPTVGHFEEAVSRAQRELERRKRRPEAPLPLNGRARKPLPRDPERTLTTALELVMERAEDSLLPATRRHRLVEPASVRWSNNVVSSYLAMWRLGSSPSEHHITVNVLLQTHESIVSDELLGFLIWHEVVHSVTPGQGHDAEFEELEMRWPNAVELNADLDALTGDWSCEPADYHKV